MGERIGATGPEMPVVMFLDLDDFKVVNDTLGHDAGDRLLCDVAGRLRTILRSGDIAARLGGDEFAILLDDDPGLARAEAVADRIIDALRATLEGQEITIGVSIGIAAARTGISATNCCATRTSPCTRRRPPARTGSRSSSRPSTPPSWPATS